MDAGFLSKTAALFGVTVKASYLAKEDDQAHISMKALASSDKATGELLVESSSVNLVRKFKLETKVSAEYIQHVRYVPGRTFIQRTVRAEEKWTTQKHLGRGTFGVVTLQRCVQGDSRGFLRAVKKIQKVGSIDFQRELETIAMFSQEEHEQFFVKFLGWYDDEDSISVAMEYLPHGGLHQYLGSPLPEQEAQKIVHQILKGLNFLHEKGSAHRNLKPSNVLVVCEGPQWWVKIADLGVSKRAVERVAMLRTQLGTPAFAAPETLDFIDVDEKSNASDANAADIWSLGAIAVTILTGQNLFKDQHCLARYISGDVSLLDVLREKDVSDKGCSFIQRLMEPKPQNRPRAKAGLQDLWLEELVGNDVGMERLENTSWRHSDAKSSTFSDAPIKSLYQPYEALNTADVAINSSAETARSALISKGEVNSEWKLAKRLHSEKQDTTEIRHVAFSPDGKLIAAASHDNHIRLWLLDSGTIHRVLPGHGKAVYGIAFSSDSKQIASASSDKRVRLWDIATGTISNTLKGHSSGVYSVVFSPKRNIVASASRDKTVRLWNLDTASNCILFKSHFHFWHVAISSNDKLIAAADDEAIKLSDLATGQARSVFKHDASWVGHVAFSVDSNTLAAVLNRNEIKLWDVQSGKIRNTIRCDGVSQYSVAFSPDGTILSGANGRTIWFWNLATMSICGALRGNIDEVVYVAFSPNTKQIASLSKSSSYGLTIKVSTIDDLWR